MEEERVAASIHIPKYKGQLFNHHISIYDKGIGIGCKEGDPNIIFNYSFLYQENEDILTRSVAELFFATQFFWYYLDLAKLIGPFE